MPRVRAGVVIVGGGVIGSSVAYQLKSAGFRENAVVLERDPTYRFASSRLAFGGLRQQFCAEVNVRLAQASVAFYERFDQAMAVEGRPAAAKFRQHGYLFLAGEAEAASLQARVATMRSLGVEVESVGPEEMRRLVPEMEVRDVVVGAFGPKDGYGDAPAVLAGFRAKAESLGVEYVADEMVSVETAGGRVRGLVLWSGSTIETEHLVCAAGAFSAAVGRAAGLDLPVVPVRQQLVRAILPRPWSYEFPVVIDPTGVHWRSAERNGIVIAKTEGEEPPGEKFGADPGRFQKSLLPVLARRVPEFAGLEEAESWAGLYEMTLDHNGIIGEHPELRGFHLACGFSGHGLMMAPATGRAVAEAILGLPPLDRRLAAFCGAIRRRRPSPRRGDDLNVASARSGPASHRRAARSDASSTARLVPRSLSLPRREAPPGGETPRAANGGLEGRRFRSLPRRAPPPGGRLRAPRTGV